MLVPSGLPFPPSKTVKHSTYECPLDKDYMEEITATNAHSRSRLETLQIRKMWMDLFITFCRSMLVHVKKHQNLLKEFDLMIGDAPPPCHVIVSELLELPRIGIAPAYVMRFGQDLSKASYIPDLFSPNGYNMNFMGRVKNVLYLLLSMSSMKLIVNERYMELKREFDIMPERPFQDSLDMAEMVLIMGHFALEYPQPILPGEKIYLIIILAS